LRLKQLRRLWHKAKAHQHPVQLQPLAILLTDAVRAGAPACLVEQLLCPVRVERIERLDGWIVPDRDSRQRAKGSRRLVSKDSFDDSCAVGGIDQCLAHAQIVRRRALSIEEHLQGLARNRHGDQCEFAAAR